MDIFMQWHFFFYFLFFPYLFNVHLLRTWREVAGLKLTSRFGCLPRPLASHSSIGLVLSSKSGSPLPPTPNEPSSLSTLKDIFNLFPKPVYDKNHLWFLSQHLDFSPKRPPKSHGIAPTRKPSTASSAIASRMASIRKEEVWFPKVLIAQDLLLAFVQ